WPDGSLRLSPWTEAEETYPHQPVASSAVRSRMSTCLANALRPVRLYQRPMPPSWPCRALASALPLVASCLSACTERPAAGTPAWLVERARQEAELAARSHVMHDFRFTDRRQASGITFENRIVDDAGRAYKLVHYDHGSGLCAADVDGDGLPDLYFTTQLGTNELWKNQGKGRFVNVTDEAGLGMPDAIAVG